MKIHALGFALVFALCTNSVFAQEQKKQDEFAVKEDTARTGSMIKRAAVTSKLIPLNKAYHELSTEQKNYLKSQYENMAENDEPPYPLDGPAKSYKALSDALKKLGAYRGKLSVLVDVNSEGVAENASILETPDDNLGVFAAKVMLIEKFKPALCAGKPCKMQYLFEISIRVE